LKKIACCHVFTWFVCVWQSHTPVLNVWVGLEHTAQAPKPKIANRVINVQMVGIVIFVTPATIKTNIQKARANHVMRVLLLKTMP
jgi:hypothetical protein